MRQAEEVSTIRAFMASVEQDELVVAKMKGPKSSISILAEAKAATLQALLPLADNSAAPASPISAEEISESSTGFIPASCSKME